MGSVLEDEQQEVSIDSPLGVSVADDVMLYLAADSIHAIVCILAANVWMDSIAFPLD